MWKALPDGPKTLSHYNLMTNHNDFHERYLEQKATRAIWESPDLGCIEGYWPRESVNTYFHLIIMGFLEKEKNKSICL